MLRGHWFLEEGFFHRACDMYGRFTPDAAAVEAFIERRSQSVEGVELFVRNGDVAHVPVIGALTKIPDFFFSIFSDGSTTYGDINAGVRAADADDEIEKIVLEVDSPGGELPGFFDAAAAIAATAKPIEAQVTDMAFSAAFVLASQADRITVNNRGAMVGSVGVVTSIFVSDSRVDIASTEAPDKKPDVTTDKGVANVRAQLDPIHEEFAGVIATGRGVSLADVNANFGRGGMVIAATALQSGMIDGILDSQVTGDPAASGTTAKKTETISMTLEELRAAHPALCTALIGEGRTAGIAHERDRVSAHIEAGRACKNMELAAGYISDGSDYSSQVVQAKYNTAGRNEAETDDRAAEDVEAERIAAAKTDKGEGKADADALTNAVFDELDAGNGISSVEA